MNHRLNLVFSIFLVVVSLQWLSTIVTARPIPRSQTQASSAVPPPKLSTKLLNALYQTQDYTQGTKRNPELEQFLSVREMQSNDNTLTHDTNLIGFHDFSSTDRARFLQLLDTPSNAPTFTFYNRQLSYRQLSTLFNRMDVRNQIAAIGGFGTPSEDDWNGLLGNLGSPSYGGLIMSTVDDQADLSSWAHEARVEDMSELGKTNTNAYQRLRIQFIDFMKGALGGSSSQDDTQPSSEDSQSPSDDSQGPPSDETQPPTDDSDSK
ncbi:hypothetical protein ABKN59_002385 [Abortiporus biennis]